MHISKAFVISSTHKSVRSTKAQSLLNHFKTTDLAKSIGINVNKLTTSNETCDSKCLILTHESKSTNSFEFIVTLY